MDAPQIQYAKTEGGVSIAYWTMGEGTGTPLLMSPPLGWSHISYELENADLASWYKRLASKRKLVRYDPRNQGLSDRGIDRLSEADQTADIEAMAGQLGAERVDLLGVLSPGAPMVRFAAEHPDAVRKLVLWRISLDAREVFANPRMLAVRGLSETDWVLFTETFTRTLLGWSGDEAHEWAGFMRLAINQDDAGRLLSAWSQIDWSPWLEKISAPTLVVRDWTAQPGYEQMAPRIPGSRLVDLSGRARMFENESGTRAVEEFLAEGEESVGQAHLTSGTAIIFFADIADSTALTERLGDSGFREKARTLDEALRSAITNAGGTVVEGKLLGDGVLAVFTSAREAIACAGACHSAAQDADLQLHIGIHAGDVIHEDGNVYGGAVNIAARVADAADAGETFVSQTVRDLARTSAGVAFEDRGERELKGVSESVRLWAVRAEH